MFQTLHCLALATALLIMYYLTRLCDSLSTVTKHLLTPPLPGYTCHSSVISLRITATRLPTLTTKHSEISDKIARNGKHFLRRYKTYKQRFLDSYKKGGFCENEDGWQPCSNITVCSDVSITIHHLPLNISHSLSQCQPISSAMFINVHVSILPRKYPISEQWK